MNHITSVGRPPCPGCGKTETDVFFELDSVPVNCSALWDTKTAATSCRRGPIGLSLCQSCGLVFNAYYDEQLLEYSDNYDNSLDFSPTFRRYAGELAKNLVARHSLTEKRIVGIGSGKGEFLRLLAANGAKSGIGFDPSYAGDADRSHPNLRFIQGYYGEEYASEPVDFVCCRHVLEHIPEPLTFLKGLRRILAQHGNVTGYFEVPNGELVLSGPGMWDVIYPHVSYFTAGSLRRLFQNAGFTVLDSGSTYSGQFLFIEVQAGNTEPLGESHQELSSSHVGATRRKASDFARTFAQSIASWSEFLAAAATKRQRVAFWGVGAKGVTFLNVTPSADQISCVVDLNSRKHAKYVPGTGQQISVPSVLKEWRPSYVLALNPVYKREIESMVSEMSVDAEVVTAVSEANTVASIA